jgi:transcriptional regulator with XRE-family HTH domain
LEARRIPRAQLEYFQARLMLRFYSMIQSTFHRLRKEKGFSKADLARRLGKGQDQVTRWMNSPSNLTIKTISDLLLAMGYEPELDLRNLERGAIAPTQEAWLHHNPASEARESDTPKQEKPRERMAADSIFITVDVSTAVRQHPNVAVKKGALAAMDPRPPATDVPPHFVPPEIKNQGGALHAAGLGA